MNLNCFPDDSPFRALQISSHQPLAHDARTTCSKCSKSIKFYCPRCLVPSPDLVQLIPRVSLPIRIEILKHIQELDGKSTALHAKIISPDQVDVYPYNKDKTLKDTRTKELENSLNDPEVLRKTVLLFPTPGAKYIHEIDVSQIDRIVVVDGTWKQAKAIARDHPWAKIQAVKLSEGNETLFWRYQDLGKYCLSTIEAMYHVMRDIEKAKGADEARIRQLDNMLYFFSHQYHLIQETYKKNPDRAFTKRHADAANYIKK